MNGASRKWPHTIHAVGESEQTRWHLAEGELLALPPSVLQVQVKEKEEAVHLLVLPSSLKYQKSLELRSLCRKTWSYRSVFCKMLTSRGFWSSLSLSIENWFLNRWILYSLTLLTVWGGGRHTRICVTAGSLPVLRRRWLSYAGLYTGQLF